MSSKEKELEEIKAKAQEMKRAIEDAGEAQASLWSSSIDMAIATGDVDSLKDLVKPGAQAAWGDNNCQCSAK
jgi:hypothetical protein